MRIRGHKLGQVAVYGKAASGGGGFSLAFQNSSLINDTTHTTIDYGTIAFTAGATRTSIAIGFFAGASVTNVIAVTIGGVSLTQVPGAYIQNGGAFGPAVDVWESSAPLSGSSGDVQVTFSTVLAGASAVGVYNLTTGTPAAGTPGITPSGFGPTVAASVIIPSGGGGIVVIVPQNGTALSTITNGAIDAQAVGFGARVVFGHTTSTGSITITGNAAGNDIMAMSVVPWAP